MLLTASEWPRLGYFHDAKVLAVVWDISDPSQRQLILDLICDPESGDKLWQGKQLRVVFSNTIAVLFRAWGYCIGDEYVSIWGTNISKDMQTSLNYLSGCGVAIPEGRFSIAFSSGSEIEVVCGQVAVEDKSGG